MRNMMLQAEPNIAIKQYAAIINMMQSFQHLADINCPTLVVRGKYDQRHPLQGHQKLSREIPHSEFIIIDNSAHFVPLSLIFYCSETNTQDLSR